MVRQINFIPRRQCRGRRNLSARKILHRRRARTPSRYAPTIFHFQTSSFHMA